jgi:peptide/nickel transport system permease protein
MVLLIRESVFAERIARVPALIQRLDASSRVALLVLGVLALAAMLAPVLTPYEPSQQMDIVALKNRAPSLAHPFGTDRFSRDVLTRVLHGARVSLSVAILAVIVSALVGTLYGLLSAVAGNRVDSVLMRLLDAMLSIPRVLLLIAILALWNPVPITGLILILGLTGWFRTSRLVRAEALSMRERDFIAAARSLGAGRRRIMFRHLLPNVLAPVIVAAAIDVGNVIVLEAGLSFIGIGAREPVPSWGTMFQEGAEVFAGTWWLALFPGLAIVLTVLCVNIVGDGLRTLLDPRHLPNAPLGTRTAAATPTGR